MMGCKKKSDDIDFAQIVSKIVKMSIFPNIQPFYNVTNYP